MYIGITFGDFGKCDFGTQVNIVFYGCDIPFSKPTSWNHNDIYENELVTQHGLAVRVGGLILILIVIIQPKYLL
jgi:hypothetical protein